jgi:hypothetical protein
MVKCDSSLQIMFPLLQSPKAVSFTPLQSTLGIAHGDLRLVCGCSAMETNLMNLQIDSSCADVASRGSLKLGSEVTRSVSFCGLPLRS